MLAGRLWREPFFHHGRKRIIRWGRGRGLHPQGSYRLRPRLRWGGLLPRSGTRREVRRWLGRGMPGEDRRGPSRGGATLPGPLRGRDPEGGGDRKPEGRLRSEDGKTCGPLGFQSPFFIPPAYRVGTYLVTYTTITAHERDGGRIWWRYAVHASRELTSGESSGGSKVSTDGCSSTTRRQARPMPKSSPTVVGVAGRWSGRLLGRRPLP